MVRPVRPARAGDRNGESAPDRTTGNARTLHNPYPFSGKRRRSGDAFRESIARTDREKARAMVRNYLVGLVAIAVILVACPYLVKGIAAVV